MPIYFITICCSPRGRNQLCHPEIGRIIFESVEFRILRGDCWMKLLLLMPDHLHALGAFPKDRDFRQVISTWKGVLAKTAGIAWQRDFFDHRVRDQRSCREKETYIRMNPVRKALVDAPERWAYVWESSP